MQTQPGSPFFRRLSDWIVRLRWPLLVLVALASGYLGMRAGELRFDSSNEIWMVEGDPSLALTERFEALFGNDDFIFVLLDAGDFFRAEPIRRLAALAEDLGAEVPHLLDTTWIGSAEWIEGREESIEIEPLMDPLPETPEALARARARALSEPSYVDALISADAAVAGVLLEMDAYPAGAVDPRKDVAPVVRAILARPEHADLATRAVGGPILDYDIDVLSLREMQQLGILCLLVQMGVLLWVGRGPRAVWVPAAVVVIGIVWTFGLIAMLGYTLNMTVIMVPVLLICVGIGDSMHVIAEWSHQWRSGLSRAEALRSAMGLVAWPCLLTSLTTAAGFLSFLAADIRPFRELGTYAAIGVMLTLGLSLVLVPTLYSFGRAHAPAARGPAGARRRDVFDRLLAATGRGVVARPRTIVLGFALIAALSAVAYTQLEIETNTISMFRQNVPIRLDFEWVDAHMGGSMSLEIVIDTGRPDGILDPDFLRRLDELDRRVAAHPLTSKTTSILDVLRKMRKAFHENRDAYYGIPETRDEAAQYLLLYEISGGEERGKLVSFTNDVARLTARTRSLSTADVRRFAADVEGWAGELFGGDVRVELTGMLAWARSMNDLVSRGQRSSFTAAFLAITLMMGIVLRSIRLGLISMLPNVFPVLVTLGFMGATGIEMDIMTMSFSALIIGVAVDDTIHFFVRFRSEFARLGDYPEALEATLTSVGRPITFTTLALTLGFAVLAASDVASLGRFGLLSGFAFAWALLADFMLAPAMLVWLRPLGPGRVDAETSLG